MLIILMFKIKILKTNQFYVWELISGWIINKQYIKYKFYIDFDSALKEFHNKRQPQFKKFSDINVWEKLLADIKFEDEEEKSDQDNKGIHLFYCYLFYFYLFRFWLVI